jgi:hypothetical protein
VVIFDIGFDRKLIDMEPEIDGLIRIFDSLSATQQAEAIRRLNTYIEASQETRQRIIRESQPGEVRKVDVGPLGRICPYCGR